MAHEVEAEIERGQLPAGHKLGTKDEIRRRFGVAVGTVNEALRILDMQGLVEVRPGVGGGVFVRVRPTVRYSGALSFDLEGGATIAEWREVRDAIEPIVCRKAALRSSAGDAVALREILELMREALDDHGRFMSLNFRLHRRIAEIAENAPVRRLYLAVLDVVEGAMGTEVRDSAAFDTRLNLEIHEDLVDAVLAGPPDRLEAAIRRHTPAPS